MGEADSDRFVAFTMGNAARPEVANLLTLGETQELYLSVLNAGTIFNEKEQPWTLNGRRGILPLAKKKKKDGAVVDYFTLSNHLRRQQWFLDYTLKGNELLRNIILYVDAHVTIPAISEKKVVEVFKNRLSGKDGCKVMFATNFRGFLGDAKVVQELMEEYGAKLQFNTQHEDFVDESLLVASFWRDLHAQESKTTRRMCLDSDEKLFEEVHLKGIKKDDLISLASKEKAKIYLYDCKKKSPFAGITDSTEETSSSSSSSAADDDGVISYYSVYEMVLKGVDTPSPFPHASMEHSWTHQKPSVFFVGTSAEDGIRQGIFGAMCVCLLILFRLCRRSPGHSRADYELNTKIFVNNSTADSPRTEDAVATSLPVKTTKCEENEKVRDEDEVVTTSRSRARGEDEIQGLLWARKSANKSSDDIQKQAEESDTNRESLEDKDDSSIVVIEDSADETPASTKLNTTYRSTASTFSCCGFFFSIFVKLVTTIFLLIRKILIDFFLCFVIKGIFCRLCLSHPATNRTEQGRRKTFLATYLCDYQNMTYCLPSFRQLREQIYLTVLLVFYLASLFVFLNKVVKPFIEVLPTKMHWTSDFGHIFLSYYHQLFAESMPPIADETQMVVTKSPYLEFTTQAPISGPADKVDFRYYCVFEQFACKIFLALVFWANADVFLRYIFPSVYEFKLNIISGVCGRCVACFCCCTRSLGSAAP